MSKYIITFFADPRGDWITRKVKKSFASYGAARVWAYNNMTATERAARVDIDF